MAVQIKSEREIALIRESCHLLKEVHELLAKFIRPGVSTQDIDIYGDKLIRERGCLPSFRDYEGYPASICVSVNEVVVHGIPSKKKILKEGDIVSLDAGMIYHGYHSDAARTVAVGDISQEAADLIKYTREAFFKGAAQAVAGNHVGDISNAVAGFLTAHGYGIVRDLVGHGVGAELHEDPEIPNFETKKRGVRLRPGMTLAIEPMVNIGSGDVEFLDDGWTCVTKDRSLSAHYENTILVTEGEPEILTL